MKPILVLFLFTAVVYSQQPAPAPSIQAESSGKCSPNILSNKGTVQFVCNTSMDAATAAKIVALLNRILQQESGSDGQAETNHKLDEILGFLRSEAQIHEQRQLPSDKIEAIKQYLSTHTAKISIFYSGQDGEAYQLAKKISEILVSSGWSLKDPITAMMLFPGGGAPPPYGLEVKYRGEKVGPNVGVHYDSSTPWGVLTGVLVRFYPESFHLTPDANMDADLIQLYVYPNPKSNPAASQSSR